MGTLFTALGAAAALAVTDIIPVHQGGARAVGLTGAQLLTLVGTTYVPLAGGTMTGALTIASGTLTALAPALNITQTWNAVPVQFNALLINITDSGSASPSTFFEMQMAGTPRHQFTKGGRYQAASGAFAGPGASSGVTSTGVAINCFGIGIRNSSLSEFSWTSGNLNGTVDLALYRDAAATLAQRNGTNAQTFRAYNTYTDSSNGEWGTFGWVANELVIGTEKNGATSNRATKILSATDLKIHTSNGGNVYIGGNSTQVLVVQYNKTTTAYPLENTSYTQMTEMTAPGAGAANTVRIYAEDNGAGKTRLMAIFASGAAQQLAIEP